MKNVYRTKCKAAIMEYLCSHREQSFRAADIYDDMRKRNIEVNLVTVYRNLERLTEAGSLMKYKTSEDESFLYQYVESGNQCQEHLHMQCRRCGRLFHMECDFMDDIKQHLQEHHGFELDCSGSVLTGICEKCRMQN